jgi:pantetheine-phosphate adenylyltransferase
MKTNATIGLYAGSFNPFHVGHLSIVNQAKEVFNKVIVAQGINPDKNYDDSALFPESYLASINVETRSYNCLLTTLIEKIEQQYSATNVVLVRGLRNGADLEYEQNLIAFLRGFKPGLKVTAFYCDPIYRHVSSSALRGIQKFSEQEYRKYVV